MSMTTEDCQIPRDPRPAPSISSNVLSQFDMRGRVVAVTGASDGLGYAVSEGMAEAGADVALTYNSNDAAVQKAIALAEKHKIRARAYKLDVADPAAVERTVEAIVSDFGRLDVFVANAGLPLSKSVIDMDVADYRRCMSVNVDGVFYCAKYAGAVFRRQHQAEREAQRDVAGMASSSSSSSSSPAPPPSPARMGNLIITSSMAAQVVSIPADASVYCASKAAVTQLGRALAREYREFARVNVVAPGFFDTAMGASDEARYEVYRMTALARQGRVNEIKGIYLFLASDASSYQTGSEVVVDGGYTLP